MKILEDAIRKHGEVLSDVILKVDAFLNHQVDASLTLEIGKEFARRFRSAGPITKVLTLEASGIHFALATAAVLGVPFVYAKKIAAVTMTGSSFTATVNSFTRKESFNISCSKRYLSPTDRILIVDDFLATGDALVGLRELVLQAGATLVGVGAVIEKSFQDGRRRLEATGTLIHSLARVRSMSPTGGIQFIPDEFVDTDAPEVKSPSQWWSGHPVSELKLARPTTIESTASVADAILRLKTLGCSQLPVLAADGEILGSLALTQLTSSMLIGAVAAHSPVTSCLFAQPIISRATTLGAVAKIIERDPFALIVSQNEAGKPVPEAIVTRIDLLAYIVSSASSSSSPAPSPAASSTTSLDLVSPSAASSSAPATPSTTVAAASTPSASTPSASTRSADSSATPTAATPSTPASPAIALAASA